MSIASRIENMYDNVDKAYKSIGDLGVDLTNVDKNLENISTKIEEIYDTLPKVESEDTDQPITLENTAKGKLKLDYKGNTYQYSTTGKNLLAYSLTSLKAINTTGTWSGNVYTLNNLTFTVNEDLSTKVNGTANAETIFIFASPSLATGQYILSGCPSGGSISTYRINWAYAGATDTGSGATADYTGTVGQTRIIVANGQNINNLTFYPMIRLSSITDGTYEPPIGITPRPDYPQDIHTCSGDNEIRVYGKNLFNKNTALLNKGINANTGGTKDQNNIFVSDFIKVTPNTSYRLSGGITSAFGYDINKAYIGTIADSNGDKTINTGNAEYIRVKNWSSSGEAEMLSQVNSSQLELGNSSTSYTPYQSQTQLISLGSIELCKIGTYQDYIYKDSGKWYVHKEIGKFVLDGSEEYGTLTSPNRFVLSQSYNVTNDIQQYSNYYKWNSWGNADNSIDVRNNGIRINNVAGQTTEQFKTWLSTHNTIIYYVLATPTDTEITDTTLISQLENTLYSYQEQTNISQENNDEPFIIKASALYDFASLE